MYKPFPHAELTHYIRSTRKRGVAVVLRLTSFNTGSCVKLERYVLKTGFTGQSWICQPTTCSGQKNGGFERPTEVVDRRSVKLRRSYSRMNSTVSVERRGRGICKFRREGETSTRPLPARKHENEMVSCSLGF